MRVYKCLHIDKLTEGKYTLVPIRDEDKYEIMNWRNAQLDVLRQQTPLTKEQQEHYFKTVVASLFDKEQPEQILFSFLENNELIGYGGLVHIDWTSKTAEVSFLTQTSRNISKHQFVSDWENYLTLLKKIAKDHLHFKSIFTYAYDIRPDLYIALAHSGFIETKRYRNHVKINNEMKDVVIHSCYFSDLRMRMATLEDVELYFQWANDQLVRENSYNSALIDHAQHVTWFTNKLRSGNCFFYLFSEKNLPVGQVRIDRSGSETVVGISIDEKYRGKGLGVEMLNMACSDHLFKFQDREIIAYIKADNTASLKQFTKAGFSGTEKVMIENMGSYRLKRSIT